MCPLAHNTAVPEPTLPEGTSHQTAAPLRVRRRCRHPVSLQAHREVRRRAQIAAEANLSFTISNLQPPI